MAAYTRTECAAVRVERREERSAVLVARRGARLAPLLLSGDGDAARVALVPLQAGPLGGDADRVTIVVGAAATLVLVPVAATLALAGPASLAIEVTIGAGGTLVVDDGATILTARASLRRRVAVKMAASAALVLRETVVLGRCGEPGGAVDALTRVVDVSGPLLHDTLRLAGGHRCDHVALGPTHRVLGSVAALGRDATEHVPAGAMLLARGGWLMRCAGAELHTVEAGLRPAWAGAVRTALDRQPTASPSASLP